MTRRPWVLMLLATIVTFPVVAAVAFGDPAGGGRWSWSLPKGFPVPRVPAGNGMNAAKVEFGRRLFYDRRLSGNRTQSCGSCHIQGRAFTDGRAVATGSTGELHPRNTQSLVNVAYQQTLTWANPALVRLERQMEVPLFGEHPVEMGVDDNNRGRVLTRIRRDRWYRRNFGRAFPERRGRPIGWGEVVGAIAAFERSIISADSRLDRARRGKAALTASERRGSNLFFGEQAECHHCHGSFIFNDQVTFVASPKVKPVFHNTGLYNIAGTGSYKAPNLGAFDVTARKSDMGAFKAPSLRNVELTAPYMHDGSVATLREVIDLYAAGGRHIESGPDAGDGRLNPYKDPEIAGIELSERDREDLVAFLRTLTDRSVTTDPRFADPFRRP